MNAMTAERCRWRACNARIRWATTERGKNIPLDANPVPAGTKGALVLVGEVAMSEVSAIRRVQEMFGLVETAAYARVHDEYGWHLSHFATCPFADQSRRRRG